MNGAPANPISGVPPSSPTSALTASVTAATSSGSRSRSWSSCVGAADRVGDDRPGAGHDVEVDADRLERHHDVGEEDGRVDAVAAHRLQGDLDDQVGAEARLQHRDALADRAVLRQRAAGLAHEPHGRGRRVRRGRPAGRRCQVGVTVTRFCQAAHVPAPSACGVSGPRLTADTPTIDRWESDSEIDRTPPAVRRRRRAAEPAAVLRPEVVVDEMPAPQRIAPFAHAISGRRAGRPASDEIGTGRFILLHDPAGNDAWDGTFRCVDVRPRRRRGRHGRRPVACPASAGPG